MKDTHDLGFKFREFESHDETAGMQDEVETYGKQLYVATKTLTHAALDAIALMRFADDLADG